MLLNTVKNASGAWVASAIRAEQREMEDKDEAEVEGVITAFTSTASFSVNGLPVDASKAAFPDGTAGVVLGARVEVEGAIANGVLVATKVELEDENDDKNKDRNELNGTISALNTPAKTFVVRGVTVHYSATTVFEEASRPTSPTAGWWKSRARSARRHESRRRPSASSSSSLQPR